MTEYHDYTEISAEQRQMVLDADAKKAETHEKYETERERLRLASYEKNRERRSETLRSALAGFAVLLVIGAILGLIFYAMNRPSSPNTEDQREVQCLADGGGWIPDDLLSVGDSGLCLYPGTSAK